MTLFKPRVGKVIFVQTTGGLCVIIPFIYLLINNIIDYVLCCDGGFLALHVKFKTDLE